MDGQLAELLTKYGRVAGVWFDGMWDNGQVDWQLLRTYAMIKTTPALGPDRFQPQQSAPSR